MSDEPEKTSADTTAGSDGGDDGADEIELPALSALLKRSLTQVEPELAAPASDESEKDRLLLVGVQRKLRKRSKGKFYADGWSTSASRVNYALVAGVMLVVIVAVYLALGPMGVSLH
jgi:hypothetical protein